MSRFNSKINATVNSHRKIAMAQKWVKVCRPTRVSRIKHQGNRNTSSKSNRRKRMQIRKKLTEKELNPCWKGSKPHSYFLILSLWGIIVAGERNHESPASTKPNTPPITTQTINWCTTPCSKLGSDATQPKSFAFQVKRVQPMQSKRKELSIKSFESIKWPEANSGDSSYKTRSCYLIPRRFPLSGGTSVELCFLEKAFLFLSLASAITT